MFSKGMNSSYVSNTWCEMSFVASPGLQSVPMTCSTLPMFLLGDSRNRSLLILLGRRFQTSASLNPGMCKYLFSQLSLNPEMVKLASLIVSILKTTHWSLASQARQIETQKQQEDSHGVIFVFTILTRTQSNL